MSDQPDKAISRRAVLSILGMGAASLALTACGNSTTAPASPTTAAAAGGTTAATTTTAAATTSAATTTTAAVATTASAAATTASSGITTTSAATAASAAINPEGNLLIWSRTGDLFQVFDAAIPAFNQKYPKIKITHQPVETSKIPPTLASGVGVPDGAFIEDENLGAITPHLYDLTSWMQPYVNDLVGYKVRVNTTNGKILGIPYDVDPGLLYYRADILQQNGVKIEDIKTYSDLLTAAKQLKDKNPKLKPIRVENDPNLIVLWTAMFANQQKTSYVDAQGNLQLESQPFLNIMNFLKSATDGGLTSRVEVFSPGDIAAADQDIQVFVPYAIWYNYGIGNLLKASKGKWRATRLPAWEAGGSTAASMGGSSFIIPAKGKSPQLAWLFYEFMMLSAEGNKAAFGANKIYPAGIDTLLPAYKPAYANKLMADPAGLGGQNLWELATSVANDIPPNYYFPSWYNQMGPIFGANVQRLYDGKLSPQEVLANSAKDIKSKLIR